ncbi:hypothetical protein CsSME_00016590 [Camellia sinensis var. sinensis]
MFNRLYSFVFLVAFYSTISSFVRTNEVFMTFNAGGNHNLDLNLMISAPSSGDGPKDNGSLRHLQFHPYEVHGARRSNVILKIVLSIFPFLAIVNLCSSAFT